MRMGVLGLAALAGACGRTPAAETTLTVSVAASVREVVAAVGEDFRRRHPEVRFALNPGSSGLLAQQITLGAPVDVVNGLIRVESAVPSLRIVLLFNKLKRLTCAWTVTPPTWKFRRRPRSTWFHRGR